MVDNVNEIAVRISNALSGDLLLEANVASSSVLRDLILALPKPPIWNFRVLVRDQTVAADDTLAEISSASSSENETVLQLQLACAPHPWCQVAYAYYSTCKSEIVDVKLLEEQVQSGGSRHLLQSLAQVLHTDELEALINIIVQMAIDHPEDSASIADFVCGLRDMSDDISGASYSKRDFTRSFLFKLQNEFESCCEQNGQMLACIELIGHLFVRKSIAVKVIGTVVHDLIGITAGQESIRPEGYHVSCVCRLLLIIGGTLDEIPPGVLLCNQFSARLIDLKRTGYLDLRTCRQIQDILDLRLREWK
jgi:hypothetical protein